MRRNCGDRLILEYAAEPQRTERYGKKTVTGGEKLGQDTKIRSHEADRTICGRA